ncbi:MAG: cytochrome c oxidase assembly protein [Chloroflexi bacterium]|nr:cytochrome c oxidase assembly protein [Chloroflexota bacterium]
MTRLVALAPGVDGRYLRFSLYPDVFCVMAALAVGYWYAVTRVGPALGGTTTRRQKAWWYASVATLFVFAEWPLHGLAEHYSYALHMLEHEGFVMVAAPMMLLGSPDWLIRWAVVRRPWYGLVRLVSRPIPAGALFTVVLLVSHWPAAVDESTHNEPVHFAAHLVLFLSGLAFWMPLVNRMPGLPRLTRPAKILYLFVTSIPATLPTIMLIFTVHVLYPAYQGWPQYLGWSNKADQEMAGVIMGAFVAAYVWVLATYHFFAWWGEEQRLERLEGANLPDDLTWADVERALSRRP